MACAARIGCAHQSQRSGSLVVVFTRCSRASIASPLRPLKQGACRREDLRPRRDLRGWERPGACQVGAHPVSRLSRSAALTAGTRSPSVAAMDPLALGRLRISTLVERTGPTRPTWLFPDAAPEAVERHRDWLAPHFVDARGRFLQSIHSFVIQAPDVTLLVDTCVGNDKDRCGREPFHMMHTSFLDDLRAAGVP